MKLTNLKVTAIAVTSLIVFGFAGCQQNANKNEPVANNAKSTDLIKFNITENTQYLATQFAAGTLDSNKTKKTNSGTINNEDTLLSVVIGESNELKEEKVIEIPKEKYQLAASCETQPVFEIYKCPYTENVSSAAKGVYTVFEWSTSDWKDVDGTPVKTNIGQILYVKPDGTCVDILNFDNNVDYHACTWLKRNYGNAIQFREEYIQFDKNGNIYILAKKGETEAVVFKYNPSENDKNKAVTPYKVGLNEEINSFRITRDGQWIIVRTMVENKYNNNNVYAIKADSGEKIALFQTDENSQSVVDSLGINNDTGNVYWYVNEEQGGKMAQSGLYVAKRNNGSYSAENVEWYSFLAPYMLRAAIKEYITDTKKDYTSLLNYIKKFCGYKSENIELNLSKMKDATAISIDIPGQKDPAIYDLSSLYKTDENGNPLKNEEALTFLIEKTDIFDRFLKGADFYFPFKDLMFVKGSTETAWKMYEEVEKNNPDILKSKVVFLHKGRIFANNEGTWVYANDDDSKNENYIETYAKVLRIANAEGKLSLDRPGNLSAIELKTILAVDGNKDDDSWYKLPFATNINGFAAISKDQKTIYYHSSGETKDLLEKDSNKDSIGTIYSFSLDDEKLIYNAVKTNGGYMMVSIDLATGEATKLPIEKQLESMLSL